VTTDIEADVKRLKAKGVKFITEEPAEVKDSLGGTTRFICFYDPDGTVIELVEMGTAMGFLSNLSKMAAKKNKTQ
jgi:hypothetical protein